MVQTFSKPQAAREIEARARAKRLGVRVRVIEQGQAYSTLSQTEPGTTYTVARTRTGWTCECKGFECTGCCKHVAAVERRAEREAWDFGVVAAIGQRDSAHDEMTRRGLSLITGGRLG